VRQFEYSSSLLVNFEDFSILFTISLALNVVCGLLRHH
jgi:hypothetical protein